MSFHPVLDPAVREFLQALEAGGSPGLCDLPVEVAREMASIGQLRVKIAKAPAGVEDLEIPVGPRGVLRVRIVRPPSAQPLLPAVMYFHGGGWMVNDCETHDRLVRDIATGSGCAVVFAEYSRVPEARYPLAIEEAYAATRWVAEHGQEAGLRPDQIAVMGDSAGGNMAIAVTLLARQRGGPKLAAQILFNPTTDFSFDTDSYRQFAEGYFLTREDMKRYWEQYVPDTESRGHPTVSPLRASVDELRGLPPAVIITSECDVVRDEGEAYARKLMQAGVPVIATRYLGTIHAFNLMNALAHTPASRAATAQASLALREFFVAQGSAAKG
jgi:acetyl esterase